MIKRNINIVILLGLFLSFSSCGKDGESITKPAPEGGPKFLKTALEARNLFSGKSASLVTVVIDGEDQELEICKLGLVQDFMGDGTFLTTPHKSCDGDDAKGDVGTWTIQQDKEVRVSFKLVVSYAATKIIYSILNYENGKVLLEKKTNNEVEKLTYSLEKKETHFVRTTAKAEEIFSGKSMSLSRLFKNGIEEKDSNNCFDGKDEYHTDGSYSYTANTPCNENDIDKTGTWRIEEVDRTKGLFSLILTSGKEEEVFRILFYEESKVSVATEVKEVDRVNELTLIYDIKDIDPK